MANYKRLEPTFKVFWEQICMSERFLKNRSVTPPATCVTPPRVWQPSRCFYHQVHSHLVRTQAWSLTPYPLPAEDGSGLRMSWHSAFKYGMGCVCLPAFGTEDRLSLASDAAVPPQDRAEKSHTRPLPLRRVVPREPCLVSQFDIVKDRTRAHPVGSGVTKGIRIAREKFDSHEQRCRLAATLSA
eukprot:4234434-Amphidinium_carterae.1